MSTDLKKTAIEGFDSLSQEVLADPGPALAEARRSCPVFREAATDTWMVTRYDDVRRVLNDFETFSSKTIRTPVVPPPEFAGRLPQHDLYAATVLFLDPPEQTRVRKLIQKTLTLKRMVDQGPSIRRMANEVIDGFIGDGRCDLMNQFTEPLLWRAAVGLFGIPDSAIERLKELRSDMFALLRDTNRGDNVAGLQHELWARLADGYDYFRPFLADRRANPRDDMTTVLLEATDEDGNPAFTDDEIIMHTMGTVASSTDTTSILICNAVLLLEEHPEVKAAVRADPEKIVVVIEEALRRYPPSMTSSRIATRDVEIAGTEIPAGAVVGASLASANHDEEHFPDPECFNIERDNLQDQLGFGIGRHFCAGAPLARVAARVALETLYERIPGLRIPEQDVVFAVALSRQYEMLIAEWD